MSRFPTIFSRVKYTREVFRTVRNTACRSGRGYSNGGGDRRPTLRTRLSLESLDGRIVPSGTPTDPPPGGGTTQSVSPQVQDYDVPLQADEWVLIAQRGNENVYVTRTDGGADWVVFHNEMAGTLAAILLNSPTPFNPGEGTSAFTPDASKPSYVWDQATSTFFAAPTGSTFPTNVTGYVSGVVNYVFLQIPQPPVPDTPPDPLPPPNFDPAAPPAPPPVAAPVPSGGVTVIRVTPDQKSTIIIELPNGGSVQVDPQPGVQNPTPVKIKITQPPAEVLPPPRQVAPPPNMNPFGPGVPPIQWNEWSTSLFPRFRW